MRPPQPDQNAGLDCCDQLIASRVTARSLDMKASHRQLLRNVLQLGFGDLLGRLCSIVIIILLGHWYGIVIVGIYALAMTVSYYLQSVIDFGLRHLGARLMCQYPQSANQITHRVQRRRLLMAGAALPL